MTRLKTSSTWDGNAADLIPPASGLNVTIAESSRVIAVGPPSAPSSVPVVPQIVCDAIARMRGNLVAPHPALDEIEARVQEWAADFGLIDGLRSRERFARIRCGSCAAHTFPRASQELVELGAELIGWLFLFDDSFGEGTDLGVMTETFERCTGLLRDGTVPPRPLPHELALADLAVRLDDLADGRLRERFTSSMGRYFSGCLFEFPFRQARKPPALSGYRRLRPWSIGTFPVFDLIDVAAGSSATTLTARLEDLREVCAMLCAWVNDVHSYAKEARARDPLNLVVVLENERRQGLEDALAAAVDMYHADLDRLDAGIAALSNAPDALPHEAAFARGLRDWVHGNHAWTRFCGRYHV